ncbi:hypothetical protein J6590_050974 [Homalodisca vitripennis]|nr:hypothetical protein J6590_050974 [Homalodisca vitripennis]
MPLVPIVTLSLYADDAMFLCSSIQPLRAADVMQQQMDLLSPWLEKWRIRINTDKIAAVYFRKRHRMPQRLPPAQWVNWRVEYRLSQKRESHPVPVTASRVLHSRGLDVILLY